MSASQHVCATFMNIKILFPVFRESVQVQMGQIVLVLYQILPTCSLLSAVTRPNRLSSGSVEAQLLQRTRRACTFPGRSAYCVETGSADFTTVSMLHAQQQFKNRRPWRIKVLDRFSRLSGWRKGAFINTILVSIVFLVLLSCHIFLWAHSGSLAGYQIIYSSSCVGNGVGRLNTLLHLVINILSTLVLASTNFFMQVLNAPNREELDNAHKKGSWLDIGVPSLRNAFRVSRFKTTMWLLFFLSSIPIHLIFNSSIFAVDDRGSEFSYFVFDESVLTGGAVFDPGTSLSVPYPSSMEWEMLSDYSSRNRTWKNMTALEVAKQHYFEIDHFNRSRMINTTVEKIIAGDWQKLNTSHCESLFNTNSCSGIQTYRDVAIILRGSSGWNRSQVWNVPANESSLWDTYVPKSANNSLWFAHASNYSRYPCRMTLDTWFTSDGGSQIYCKNDCGSAMGFDTSDSDLWRYSPFPHDEDHVVEMVSVAPVPGFGNPSLSIEYCLAEPFETDCQIGVASNLLWVVSLW